MRFSSYRTSGGEEGVGVWQGERLLRVPGATRLIDLLGDDGTRLHAGDLVRLEGGPLGAIEAPIAAGRPPVPLRPENRDQETDHQEARR